jgi:hypothetical protein
MLKFTDEDFLQAIDFSENKDHFTYSENAILLAAILLYPNVIN